jgi:hypothetical protein
MMNRVLAVLALAIVSAQASAFTPGSRVNNLPVAVTSQQRNLVASQTYVLDGFVFVVSSNHHECGKETVTWASLMKISMSNGVDY